MNSTTQNSSTIQNIKQIQIEEESSKINALKVKSVDNSSASSHLKSLLGVPISNKKQPWGVSMDDNELANKISLTNIQSEQMQNMEIKSIPNINTKTISSSVGWQIPISETKSTSLSLKEIMQQEQAIQSRKLENSLPSSVNANSWAAKAGKMSTNSSGYIQESTPSLSINTILRKEQLVPNSNNVHENKITKNSVELGSSKINSPLSKTNSLSIPIEEYSDSGMTREFAEWCVIQLQKINGSNDLTLLKFCLALESSAEIREYLAAYLGSTPQVMRYYLLIKRLFYINYQFKFLRYLNSLPSSSKKEKIEIFLIRQEARTLISKKILKRKRRNKRID